MSLVRVLAGESANFLTRGAVSVSSQDSLYPPAALYDGRSSLRFRWESNVSASWIAVDLNQIFNGALDLWTGNTPDGWIASGTVVKETSIVRSGSAARCSSGGSISQGKNYRPGEVVRIQGWRRKSSTGTARAKLQNLATGNWWNGSAWVSGETHYLEDATNTSYTESDVSVTLENFAACGRQPTIPLNLILEGSGSNAYFDDWFMWPGQSSLLSAHGVNLDPVTAPLWEDSDNGSSWGTVQALTAQAPSFYGLPGTPSAKRYQRFYLQGANSGRSGVPFVSELWIGQAIDLLASYRHGSEIEFLSDDVAHEARNKDLWIYPLSPFRRRVLRVDWFHKTAAEFAEVRDEIVERSSGRELPLVIVPDTSKADVLMCRLDNTWKARRELSTIYESSQVFTELPFPPARYS